MIDPFREINNAFKICFEQSDTFVFAEKTSDIGDEVAHIIRVDIPTILSNILANNDYIVKGSIGVGRATKSPWIAILDKNITTTTREGVYIVFLFSSDYKHVYLTLNQGTTVPGQFGPRLGKKEVTNNSKRIRELLTINDTALKTDGKADIADERYKEASIYYTLWDVNNEEQGEKLLNQYLEIYKRYKELTMVKNDGKVTVVRQMKEFSIAPKYRPYTTALRTKPFMLLAGISGTGKSRIVRKLAQATTTQAYEKEEDRWKDNRPENFELIQVKPNWHNSMDVVGFYSNISKKYEFTPFIEFIVKAWQHKDTPYFLCLDEMNLAPVEEYFAEFLSAIESRSTDKDGNYVTDPIIKPFKEFDSEADKEKVSDQMIAHLIGSLDSENKRKLAEQFRTVGLTLPPNLMVMGTVNMDETTFSFSRKVLDRAMSVEMNEVDYDSFLSGDSDQFPLLTDWNEWLVNRPQKASEVKDDIDSTKVVEYLKDVNALLEDTPFKLGYRAANEAMLYVAANKELVGEKFSLTTALDEFTLMKILSRIEGDDQRLGIDENDPRIAAAHITADTDGDPLNLLTCLRAIVRNHLGNDTHTEKKIASMCRTLEREHFVSYWG